MAIFIKAVATAFPEAILDNSFFGEEIKATTSPMFMGTNLRRHIAREQLGADLIAEAFANLQKTHPIDPLKDLDMLLTNISLPDHPFTGSGAIVAKKAGLKPKTIIDIHNTGCLCPLSMLEIAEVYMKAHGYKSALICAVQTAAGRIFSQPTVIKKVQAAIPGDGCGIIYVTSEGNSEVLGTIIDNYPENSEDMFATYDCGRKYWEAGEGEGYIDFEEGKSARILIRGNRLVPAAIRKVCAKVGVKTSDISYLITNQPNMHFLRNWREAVQLKPEQHIHTFPKYANLFGAGIPVNLAEGIENNLFKTGDLICLAAFSHAGDYAGATLIRW